MLRLKHVRFVPQELTFHKKTIARHVVMDACRVLVKVCVMNANQDILHIKIDVGSAIQNVKNA